MRRREFLTLVGGLALPEVVLMRPAHAEGASKRPLIFWLTVARGTSVGRTFFAAFVNGIQDQGYVEGRDFDLVQRGAEGAVDRLPTIMEQVIQLKPDVILAPTTFEAVAAKRATSKIPIVCAALADAVSLGLIASEARPGGNEGLPAKQIELAREIVPSARKIGLLTNQEDPKGSPQARDLETAGQALGLQIVSANANRPENIEDALQALPSERVGVAIVLQTSSLVLSSSQIASSALEKRLLTVYGYREYVITGGLISYGVDLRWCYRRAAHFVIKILRGTAPSELPIEFPTGFWLAANLQTAKCLGIIVPQALLARADEVIE